MGSVSDSDVQVETAFGCQDQQLVDLIANVAQGNEQALGRLYDQTSFHVYGLAFRILNDPMLAEEVTMDVYMQVWRQACEFDQKRGKPIVWLTVLVRSRAIDRLRSNQKERTSRQSLDTIEDAPATKANPEESSASSEQRRVLQQALASLTSDQRKAIEMAYFGGLTHREIAAQIGEPLGTVKTRVRLGMVKLRNILGPLEKGLIS
ncbi:MAG: DNA-directed RNA polymerase sigma-70 factor [Nitrospirales bacterium]|nr:MAG: DNA-directed RNA polymerase sigma-70 factor [Nitrospirales bacterium]